ncbi:hypothetical protein [Pantoea ananatis]|uniref:Type VI secretion protein n=2 Tax=Pantoea ananas TaxID=553 RepID=A0AAJ1CYQ3_PANAN|nr:hypothetical protein [Pantoea ananatis]MCW0310146.1 hypothetical protein [Pantoea ananatis]MCW0341856.1 hypothetical protein [Pantoea ananatis]MCW0343591.1 hypothetical protein [Pantoea ananatis]MCW0360337.1 hypothetical protein [Pantoea ananatis]MCW0364955.1 hypothetical protein [Pantoea ananatis]
MAWPISDIPEKNSLPAPTYWLWIILLLLMLILGSVFSVELFNAKTYAKIFFYGILPSLFFWLCLFGAMLNRYEQSVVASQMWKLETEQTKAEWRDWSRRQIAVVGNVLFSPEENGMEALLGELDKVPAYPKKARPLFHSSHSFPALMKEVDWKLELQYPGYRHFLHSIYVFQAPGSFDEYRSEAVYQQWDLIPTATDTMEIFTSFYDAKISDGLILILCLQDWSSSNVGQSSEFISAQLIASPKFARQHSLPVIAGISRMMPLEAGQLFNELDMLFEYIQPDKQFLEYVWLLGAAEKTSVEIMQYANRYKWPLPEKRPLHSVDLSFGPPGEMALLLSLAMLVEAANITAKDQLLVNHTSQQTGTLCLIARELYA